MSSLKKSHNAPKIQKNKWNNKKSNTTILRNNILMQYLTFVITKYVCSISFHIFNINYITYNITRNI